MLPLLLALLSPALADTPIDVLTPELRARFEAAESAWQEGDLSSAEKAFAEVTTGAPEFDRAWRRSCGVLLEEGRVDDAVANCRKAVGLVPSIENRTGLGIGLLQMDDGQNEAGKLFEAVVKESPDYMPGWQGLCTFALDSGKGEPLTRCVTALEAAAPETAGTLFYKALLLADQGKLDPAVKTLDWAEQKGLPGDLMARGSEWIQKRAEMANQTTAGEKGEKGRHDASAWKLSDLIPFGVLAALVLAVGVLAFGRDDEDDAKPPPPRDPSPPEPPAQPPSDAPNAG